MWFVRPLTEDSIHFLHERVLEQDPNAERGYNNKRLVEVCMDKATCSYFGKAPYENIYERTAALIEGIINFHPFTDGNKRTALLTAYFFLIFHGYHLNMTYEEILDTFIDIAEEKMSDIEDIASWVEENTIKMEPVTRLFPLFIFRLLLRLLSENIDVETTLSGTNLVTLLLKKMEQEWPTNSNV